MSNVVEIEGKLFEWFAGNLIPYDADLAAGRALVRKIRDLRCERIRKALPVDVLWLTPGQSDQLVYYCRHYYAAAGPECVRVERFMGFELRIYAGAPAPGEAVL